MAVSGSVKVGESAMNRPGAVAIMLQGGGKVRDGPWRGARAAGDSGVSNQSEPGGDCAPRRKRRPGSLMTFAWSRVEMRWRCAAPSPHPARQTGRASFPYPASELPLGTGRIKNGPEHAHAPRPDYYSFVQGVLPTSRYHNYRPERCLVGPTVPCISSAFQGVPIAQISTSSTFQPL